MKKNPTDSKADPLSEEGIPREKSISRLKKESFDILVIGGGATGAGIIVDAVSRGLKAALVERDDFSAATSSRSTKLIHGGVRYLENAVLHLDRTEWNLVKDALHERSTLLKNAPHLSWVIPIVTPLYSLFDIPYYEFGLKIYDSIAGKTSIPKSRFLTKKKVIEKFPLIKKKKLKGGVLYYDGQFDDARMNVSLVKTASEMGSAIANHVVVDGLLKEEGKVIGVKLTDLLTGESWKTKSKIVINATGPFTDQIRKMDDPEAKPMLEVSSGTHIVLDKKFASPDSGFLIPKTSYGRVLFILPWNNHALIGTTDNPTVVSDNPKPSEEDIDYILKTVGDYFENPPQKKDIESQWMGLRPLVLDTKASDTASLSRDYVVNVSESNLVTVAGGKWTTYRKMALDVVDHAVKVGRLKQKNASATEDLILAGGKKFGPALISELKKLYHFNTEVAEHLAKAYGDRAIVVSEIAKLSTSDKIHSKHPYLEAEVIYAVKFESARTVVDVLARRTRMSFLDLSAALSSIPRVAELMGSVLNWDKKNMEKEIADARRFIAN